MAGPVLEVSDLTLRLPKLDPVIGLGFSVQAGEMLAIVGESGSGKSLTALATMQLLPPVAKVVSGSIRLDGRELLGLPAREMRRVRGAQVAMIFQEPMTSLNPVLTIGRQITEVLSLHEGLKGARAADRAAELLDLVGINEPRKRLRDYPHQLSGGMRQRVMIAIAVACNPRVLLADEPTTALDVTIQAQVLDLIDDLRRKLSMAVVLITHNMAVVARWADRVVVMYAGHKIEEGRVQDILNRPMHPYTRGLLAASPAIDPRQYYRIGPLPDIPGNITSAQEAPGCPFAPRCTRMQPECNLAMPATRRCGGSLVACLFPGEEGEASNAAAVGF